MIIAMVFITTYRKLQQTANRISQGRQIITSLHLGAYNKLSWPKLWFGLHLALLTCVWQGTFILKV